MASDKHNDVFISYRREFSSILVDALYQRLTAAEIDVFYDVESLGAGEFEPVILEQIRSRPYFVLVLTPGTLDRCCEPEDWLTREIETAVEAGRIIVPVYTPNFDLKSIPKLLPEGLGDTIRKLEGHKLPQEYFQYAVQALIDKFLVDSDLPAAEVPEEHQTEVRRLQAEAAEKTPVSQEELEELDRIEQSRAGTATVRAGDSWLAIASRILGDASRWQELAALNGGVDRVLHPGESLQLPADR